MKKPKKKTTKIKQKFEVELVDKFDDDDFFDDCSVCQFTKANQKLGRTPTLEEMKAVFDKANKAKKSIL